MKWTIFHISTAEVISELNEEAKKELFAKNTSLCMNNSINPHLSFFVSSLVSVASCTVSVCAASQYHLGFC